jgi:hypothetical protein
MIAAGTNAAQLERADEIDDRNARGALLPAVVSGIVQF